MPISCKSARATCRTTRCSMPWVEHTIRWRTDVTVAGLHQAYGRAEMHRGRRRPADLTAAMSDIDGFRIAIVGLGLMGGSLAMALKSQHVKCDIFGADKDPETVVRAQA